MLWARWAIAAVVTSPPQLSSIVMAMPSETQRSRACRARVRPPNLLILMFTTSIARSAWPRKQGIERVDHLIEHERMVAVPADGQAFLVASAGLFDVDVHVADGPDDAQGVVHQPAGIGVGDESVARLELGRDGRDALDVDHRIAADLQLEPAIALGAIAGHAPGHRLRRFLRDRAIQNEVLAVTPAQQHADRLARCLAEDVPASDVDGGLDIGVALERGIHQAVQLAELSRVLADRCGPSSAMPARAPVA